MVLFLWSCQCPLKHPAGWLQIYSTPLDHGRVLGQPHQCTSIFTRIVSLGSLPVPLGQGSDKQLDLPRAECMPRHCLVLFRYRGSLA